MNWKSGRESGEWEEELKFSCTKPHSNIIDCENYLWTDEFLVNNQISFIYYFQQMKAIIHKMNFINKTNWKIYFKTEIFLKKHCDKKLNKHIIIIIISHDAYKGK